MKVELSHGCHHSPAWENSHEGVEIPLQFGDMVLFGSHLAHRSAEHEAGKGYSQGWSRCAFAAPFAQMDGLVLNGHQGAGVH